MKKLLLGLATVATVGLSALNAQGTASPVHIILPHLAVDFTSQGAYINHESLERYKSTTHDFNGLVRSQIVVGGIPSSSNPYPQVKIGTSIGHYVAKQPITSSNLDQGSNYIVGYIMGYNHYTVTQGYLTSTYNNVYDSSAYIK